MPTLQFFANLGAQKSGLLGCILEPLSGVLGVSHNKRICIATLMFFHNVAIHIQCLLKSKLIKNHVNRNLSYFSDRIPHQCQGARRSRYAVGQPLTLFNAPRHSPQGGTNGIVPLGSRRVKSAVQRSHLWGTVGGNPDPSESP